MPWYYLSSEVIAVDSKGDPTHDPAKATGYARVNPPNHRAIACERDRARAALKRMSKKGRRK